MQTKMLKVKLFNGAPASPPVHVPLFMCSIRVYVDGNVLHLDTLAFDYIRERRHL